MFEPLEVLRGVLLGLGLFFPAWPLILLAPLRGRARLLPNLLLAWLLACVFGVGWLLSRADAPSWLIPDPWNGIAFLAVGALLALLNFGPRLWRRRALLNKAARTAHLYDLSAREFEELVVELFTAMGHTASRGGGGADHGVDVTVRAQNGEKWIVQAKRWRGKVGEPVVRDFYGVLHHEQADRGAIVIAGEFTDQARRWAAGKPIELIDGEEVVRMARRARAM